MFVGVDVAVGVLVAVAVFVGVGLGSALGEKVGVGVNVFVAVAVGVFVGVGLGGVEGTPAAISFIRKPPPMIPCNDAAPVFRSRKYNKLPVATTKAVPGEAAAMPGGLKISKPAIAEPCTPLSVATFIIVPELGDVPLPVKKSIEPCVTRALFDKSIS